ncbi:RNA-directed DNA polymerase, eukaryota, reverse transcriptase zinc-binding domain protein [Tanacetum coccineum]
MDTWEFIPNASRRFTVNSIQKLISASMNTNSCHHTRWNKHLPSKVNILTWHVSNKRLPIRSNLDSRGIDLDSTRCNLCDDDIETEDHVFVYFPIATHTWKPVYTWWEFIGFTLLILRKSCPWLIEFLFAKTTGSSSMQLSTQPFGLYGNTKTKSSSTSNDRKMS